VTPRHRSLPLAAAACSIAIAVGAAVAGASPASRVARGSCPSHGPTTVYSSRTGANQSLVPPSPDRLLLCRYSGINPVNGGRALTAHRLVTSRAKVTRFADEFNALPEFPPGIFNCPVDVGTAIVAYFGYPSGPGDPVRVELSACTGVTNGHLIRTAAFHNGTKLLGQLKALVR
jgi:hypothetical protein